MRKHRGQGHGLRGLVDRGRLHGGDLVLTESLAHNVEAARQGRISEGPTRLIVPIAWGPRGQGLFRVGEQDLSLGQRRRQGRN
jgi:hypothetical protein